MLALKKLFTKKAKMKNVLIELLFDFKGYVKYKTFLHNLSPHRCLFKCFRKIKVKL